MSETTPVADSTVDSKKSFVQKVVAPIKKHPKIALAIALGVSLVASATILSKEALEDDTVEVNANEDGSFTVTDAS